MTALRGRLSRLEAHRPRPKAGASRDRLAAKLARIELAIVASGDVADRPGAPPIERTVRRYLRGEAAPADALRDLVAGRWPKSINH